MKKFTLIIVALVASVSTMFAGIQKNKVFVELANNAAMTLEK